MIDIFQGEWSSLFPPPCETLRAGSIPLFQDARIAWAIQQLGSVRGFRVLELGPLEAGHSFMLDRAGASHVLAIEGSRRAYLKCLIAKEILRMPSVEFALGDFSEYLSESREKWDLCIASGVLYHMRDPMELLQNIGARAERLYLWTHYYDKSIVDVDPNLRPRFTKQIEKQTGSLSYTLQRFNYRESVDGKGFCGGNAGYSHWLTRDGILGALKHFGYRELSIGHDLPDHMHGPCFSVLAKR